MRKDLNQLKKEKIVEDYIDELLELQEQEFEDDELEEQALDL